MFLFQQITLLRFLTLQPKFTVKITDTVISIKMEEENMCGRTKDDFLTVYNKTYTRKYGFRPEKAVYLPDFKDILAGPHAEYVVPYPATELEHPFEEMNHFYHRLTEKNPKIKRYMMEPPDEGIIDGDRRNQGRTVYMVDYCDIEDGFESKKSRGRKRVSLPTDWGEIPATTQRASYRDPGRLATWDTHTKPIPPQPSALRPNVKERAILQVQTGHTEYESVVGSLGQQVMDEQLHGKHQDNLQCQIYQQMLDKITR